MILMIECIHDYHHFDASGEARDVVVGGECSVLADSGLPDSRCYFYPDKDNKVIHVH